MEKWTTDQVGEMDLQLEQLRHGLDGPARATFQHWVNKYNPGTARLMQQKVERVLVAQNKMFSK